MATAETWTIGRLLTWTTDYLKKQNVPSPRLDAELLLAEACGCERIALYTRYGEELDEATRAKFREFVKRRAEGMPVAYLLGRREFYSLSFRVTPDVLIPRPETEFAVIAALDRLKEQGSATPARVIDIGTGSGCIAITIAKYVSQAMVVAVDQSAAALAIARENAEKHGVLERISFVEGDLFAAVPSDQTFDLIVSNPPYVSEAEYSELAREVRDFEPRAALVGGPAGTEIIARLIDQAGSRLVSGGWIILEISPMIADAVKSLFTADDRWHSPIITRDLAQLPRIVQARRK